MRGVERDSGRVSQSQNGCLGFGGLVLNLESCTLVRESGEAIPLTRGEFALLRILASRAGRVVSREALLGAVSNRNLEPFDRSVDALVCRLRRKIEADPKAPRFVVTVPGEGYRFDGLNNKSHATRESGARDAETSRRDRAAGETKIDRSQVPNAVIRLRESWRRSAFAAASAFVLLAALAGWHFDFASHRPGVAASNAVATSPRLSIAVLPFEAVGGDADQETFADALSEDLTTDLLRLPASFVISRGTASAYKGRPIDAMQIGRELGVRYLVEGSVRRKEENVTVNARLVATDTGAQVWADRFEGPRVRLDELQVEFVSRLVNSIEDQLVIAESLRSPGDNSDSVDLTLRGWALLTPTDSKERFNEAIKLLERALLFDRGNIHAMTGLALALLRRAYDGWSNDFDSDMTRAEGIVSRALALQPGSSWLHHAYANVLAKKRQWRAAIAENETAIAYDPNNAAARATLGLHKMYIGRCEEGIGDIQTAIRSSPHDGSVPNWQAYLCRLNNQLGRWDEAIEWCRRSSAQNPELFEPWFGLAVAHAWAGHADEARDAVARLQEVRRGFTIENVQSEDQRTDNALFKAQLVRIVEGLRKAGLPGP